LLGHDTIGSLGDGPDELRPNCLKRGAIGPQDFVLVIVKFDAGHQACSDREYRGASELLDRRLDIVHLGPTGLASLVQMIVANALPLSLLLLNSRLVSEKRLHKTACRFFAAHAVLSATGGFKLCA